jgi:D-aminopeptidase
MTCHEFLGGTGTSSRLVNGEAGPDGKIVEGKYTVGVLCQSNYGHKKDMHIGGVPIGALLVKEASEEASKTAHAPAEEEKRMPEGGRVGDGSIVIIIMQAFPSSPNPHPPPHMSNTKHATNIPQAQTAPCSPIN